MLRVIIEGEEIFNEEDNSFDTVNDIVVDLEHSLLSLSKWESKYQKPFLSKGIKTSEEIFDYLKAMIITPGLNPDVLYMCTQKNIDSIQEYIDSSQSATTFSNLSERQGSAEVITSELIYYWMVSFNIPFECETWHLNRLLTLIRVCNVKNTKPKKISPQEMAQRNAELNAKRRAELGTKG